MKPRRSLVACELEDEWVARRQRSLVERIRRRKGGLKCEAVVCAPHGYLDNCAPTLSRDETGGSGSLDASRGAYTGTSPLNVARHRVRLGVVRTLERGAVGTGNRRCRRYEGERALQAGLRPIVCIGNAAAAAKAGQTHAVLSSQLAAVLERIGAEALSTGALAYEPVWAIGTAARQRRNSPGGARRVACADRNDGDSLRVLYGGSVKPACSGTFNHPDIDGG